jgi:quercetin dioxygenase-like cupin family protein
VRRDDSPEALGCEGLQHHRWSDLEEEALKGTITRRLITGDRMMIAQVLLKQGDAVPQHAHHNEQITYIVSGALRFQFGSDGETEVIVRTGEVLVIPANLPHAAVALEDTLDVDIFSPPREDWLNKTDDYLRRAR